MKYLRLQVVWLKQRLWINEIESTKSVAALKTPFTITEAKLQIYFEGLDSKIASGLEKIINGHFKS